MKLKGEVHRLIAPRDQKHQSNFVEFRSMKIVYRRYAGLFFCACVDANDNELAYLEAIHFFVEVLDAFFGNVCELDLVFNFYKVGDMHGILSTDAAVISRGHAGTTRSRFKGSRNMMMEKGRFWLTCIFKIGLCNPRRGLSGRRDRGDEQASRPH